MKKNIWNSGRMVEIKPEKGWIGVLTTIFIIGLFLSGIGAYFYFTITKVEVVGREGIVEEKNMLKKEYLSEILVDYEERERVFEDLKNKKLQVVDPSL